jgi:hypothetical protein
MYDIRRSCAPKPPLAKVLTGSNCCAEEELRVNGGCCKSNGYIGSLVVRRMHGQQEETEPEAEEESQESHSIMPTDWHECEVCHGRFSGPKGNHHKLCPVCVTTFINALRDCLGLAPIQKTREAGIENHNYRFPDTPLTGIPTGETDGCRQAPARIDGRWH